MTRENQERLQKALTCYKEDTRKLAKDDPSMEEYCQVELRATDDLARELIGFSPAPGIDQDTEYYQFEYGVTDA